MTYADLADALVRAVDQAREVYTASNFRRHSHLVDGGGNLIASGSGPFDTYMYKLGVCANTLAVCIPEGKSVPVNLISAWLCMLPEGTVSADTMYNLSVSSQYVSIHTTKAKAGGAQ